MKTLEKMAIVDLAETLTILCGDQTIADLLNATLSAEADERLSDWHAELADLLFDQLTELRPDCIPIAQGDARREFADGRVIVASLVEEVERE